MNIKTGIVLLLFTLPAYSEDLVKIEIGTDYKNYSTSELQRRVWELERAVNQLQVRMAVLETKQAQLASVPAASDSWICKVTAMGTDYIGTGATKAIATQTAVDKCKMGRGGDGFFCKDPKCDQ